MTAFTDLNEDVVYDILCYLPDFTSLTTASMVSKRRTYVVFEQHKGTILHSVASSLLGPVLPHALDVVRLQDGLGPVGVAGAHAASSLSVAECAQIKKNHDAITYLENLLSQRFVLYTSSACSANHICCAQF